VTRLECSPSTQPNTVFKEGALLEGGCDSLCGIQRNWRSVIPSTDAVFQLAPSSRSITAHRVNVQRSPQSSAIIFYRPYDKRIGLWGTARRRCTSSRRSFSGLPRSTDSFY
jgi:hypothetical protein